MTTTAGGGDQARRLRPANGSGERAARGPSGWREPDWAPLERVLPQELCADFMWMGWEVRPYGPPIARYKHAVTRRYLNLDEDGGAYRYVPAPEPAWCGTYVRILEPQRAIEHVLDAAPTDPRTDAPTSDKPRLRVVDP
jgi:hypothetical protein